MSAPVCSVTIVTGGSRGIGRCIVERLCADGHAVVFAHSRSDDEAAALQTAPHEAGFVAQAVRVDVATDDAASRLFDAAEALGRVTGLVNNAGITGRIGAFADLTDADLQRVVAVNLLATVRLCREAARHWRGRGLDAAIVNLSSVAARTGSPHEYVAYAATKAALETLSIGLARELAAERIRVNAVAPGTADTTIHARAGMPDRAVRVAARIPMGRAARPDEIAAAVAWLMSAQAAYVTGAVLPVSGGL
ncbi:MAG TPA: SDR family oxidoreductase [Dokdonella sp.]|uniref:SDR family NAD(P)-dependent oxidoreductase n=1 Tax=Dokdonella sp. TaxID=2291710 RepID=UPI002BB76B1B|nr:SDR family oxidoreductase [Dokdonella sp.]HUD42042.1 SDR family oxidoreductase [Dokdonella sp.]